MNSEDNNKVEEIGLPKCKYHIIFILKNSIFRRIATLSNFIKEILTSHNMKCEKQMFDLLDKITTKYAKYFTNFKILTQL